MLVLLKLADWADDDGECWPSISTIAQKCRLKDERHVKRIIHETLEQELGEVVVLRNEGKSSSRGGLRSNRYRITVHMPEDECPMVVEGPLSALDDGGPGTPQMVVDAPPPIVVERPPESSVDPSIEPSLATATPLRVDDGVFEAVLHVCGWDPGSRHHTPKDESTRPSRSFEMWGRPRSRCAPAATRYRSKFPSAALTPSALSANWPALGEAPLPLACDLAAEFVAYGETMAHKSQAQFADLLAAKTTDPDEIESAWDGWNSQQSTEVMAAL